MALETDSERIRFGDLPNQNMPRQWAEDMLRRLFLKRRKMFADLLRETILEMDPK